MGRGIFIRIMRILILLFWSAWVYGQVDTVHVGQYPMRVIISGDTVSMSQRQLGILSDIFVGYDQELAYRDNQLERYRDVIGKGDSILLSQDRMLGLMQDRVDLCQTEYGRLLELSKEQEGLLKGVLRSRSRSRWSGALIGGSIGVLSGVIVGILITR